MATAYQTTTWLEVTDNAVPSRRFKPTPSQRAREAAPLLMSALLPVLAVARFAMHRGGPAAPFDVKAWAETARGPIFLGSGAHRLERGSPPTRVGVARPPPSQARPSVGPSRRLPDRRSRAAPSASAEPRAVGAAPAPSRAGTHRGPASSRAASVMLVLAAFVAALGLWRRDRTGPRARAPASRSAATPAAPQAGAAPPPRWGAGGVAGGYRWEARRASVALWATPDGGAALPTDPPFVRVLDYWFRGDFAVQYKTKWFPSDGSAAQARTDREVRQVFGPLLRKALDGGLEDWKATPQSYLALILLLDQFARHVYRGDPQRDALVGASDRLALECAEDFLRRDWEHHLPLAQRVFLLMPFRHSPTLDRLQYVMEQIGALAGHQEDMDALLGRFKRATLRRIQNLEGSGYRPGDEVLECHPFEADEGDVQDSALYRTMRQFLTQHMPPGCRCVAVSLSGGVDSMVVAKLLKVLSPTMGGYQVLGLHIDYTNRPESGAEAKVVQRWCADQGIVFRQRVISEYRRSSTPRELYEKATRDIRFRFYQDNLGREGAPAVMFGHHQGDLQENVITNLMRRTQLLDIAGMREVDTLQGVTVWRPLLPHPKADIFDFAHKYGVPYLKDTTDPWGTRGMMRNSLMPLLQDLFGTGYLQNLSSLAKQSEDMSHLVHLELLQPFLDKLQIGSLAVWVDCSEYLDMPMVFWKVVLKHVCEKVLGIGLIPEGPVNALMLRLRFVSQNLDNPNKRNGFVQMKKDYYFYLFGTTLVFLPFEFFPKAPYYEAGEAVPEGAEEVTRGPYVIELEVVHDVPWEAVTARLTVFDVLAGAFSYYLPLGPQLVIDKDKNLRPPAFRGIPRVLTDPIPIVCLRRGSGDVTDKGFVKVTVRGRMGKFSGRVSV